MNLPGRLLPPDEEGAFVCSGAACGTGACSGTGSGSIVEEKE